MFRSFFRAPSQNFKILALPNLGFAKKHDSHKLYAKSSRVDFRSIFRSPSRNLKIFTIPNVLSHEKLYEHVSRKNVMVKNFTKSRAQSHVSINFSCTVL
ncbi:hypothetical protein BHE74_00051828 [Ensete ventricosum]|nr:hypothetical protein BHE74_00051828 [Ensete ventricosum]